MILNAFKVKPFGLGAKYSMRLESSAAHRDVSHEATSGDYIIIMRANVVTQKPTNSTT